MSNGSRAGRPSLSGMKLLVEDVISSDDDGSVMRVGDRERPGDVYALKVVNRNGPGDDGKLARCRASVEASAKLGHPAILKYHDYRTRRSWFRVARGEALMEHVAGTSLDRLGAEPTPGQWVVVFKQVAEALAHMHRRGVIHGDLTPGRILLSGAGAVKVMGYGQSLVADPAHRSASKLFAAPEKAVTEKADVYAFGALMYFLLTGKTPNALRRRAEDEAVKVPRPSALAPKVPAALDEVILACVHRHPPNRPEGAFEVLKGLQDLAGAMSLDDAAVGGLAGPKRG